MRPKLAAVCLLSQHGWTVTVAWAFDPGRLRHYPKLAALVIVHG